MEEEAGERIKSRACDIYPVTVRFLLKMNERLGLAS